MSGSLAATSKNASSVLKKTWGSIVDRKVELEKVAGASKINVEGIVIQRNEGTQCYVCAGILWAEHAYSETIYQFGAAFE